MQAPTTMTITIRDIARQLDLSIGAVSRALDGYPDISVETRQRVVEMARQMGYVPNRAARQLRKQKTDTIGYIMPVESPRFADSFFSEFIEGLGDEASVQKYDLLISTAPPGQDQEKLIYQQWVQGHKVDGLILDRMFMSDWRVQFLISQKMPFTSLETSDEGSDTPRIEVDSRSGFVELVEHVFERGFRRVAYIGGPETLRIQHDRLRGYRDGLHKLGLLFDSALVSAGDMTSAGGYNSSKRLISIPDPPDAILCINDETALGVLRAANELGMRVGKDLAVAGFDGVRDAKYSNPPLTTVDQPVYDIARQLVRMLVDEIRGTHLLERRVVLPPRLLIRESTGG